MHAFFCKCVLKTTGFNLKLFNLWVEVCTTLKMHYFQYFEFCNETFSRRPKTNTTEGKLEPEGMTIRMGMSSLVVENLLTDRRDGTPQPQHFFIIFPRWRKLPRGPRTWKDESMFNLPQGSHSCQCDSTCHYNFTLAFVMPSVS